MRIDPLPVGFTDAAVDLWQTAGLTRPWNDARADLMPEPIFAVRSTDPHPRYSRASRMAL